MNLLYTTYITCLCHRSKFANKANKEVMTIQFGGFLRKMRKHAGMSQEDIALDLNMSISNISRLETDIYELKASDLVKWANVTGSQDLLVALLCGVDVAIVQQILDSASTLVGTILLGGIL